MAENKQYVTLDRENGNILISEDVIATIVSHAISEVEGVSGLSAKPGNDIVEFIGKKIMGKAIKITIGEEDELYVLGDAMDRGPEPIRVIRDLMNRPNVFYVMGNHDSMFLSVMQKLAVDVTEENLSALTGEVLTAYQKWLLDGGAVTARQFAALPREERADILDYLACAAPYEMLEQDGKLYIL